MFVVEGGATIELFHLRIGEGSSSISFGGTLTATHPPSATITPVEASRGLTMPGHRRRGLDGIVGGSRDEKRSRTRRSHRLWLLEGVEERPLLAGSAVKDTARTLYTVDLTSDKGAGSGTKADLRYVIGQADAIRILLVP
jgi:hypothetical protein